LLLNFLLATVKKACPNEEKRNWASKQTENLASTFEKISEFLKKNQDEIKIFDTVFILFFPL